MPVCMYVYVYMCPHFFLGTLIKLFVCLLSELCALHEYKELDPGRVKNETPNPLPASRGGHKICTTIKLLASWTDIDPA